MSSPVSSGSSERVEVPKSSPAPPFTSTEQELFHTEDRRAATAIVSIMLTIFIAAVIGYCCVAYVAHAFP